MLMSRKKKLKIAKMLARIIHRIETDLDIPVDAFMDINHIAIDIADEVGGISMLNCIVDYLDENNKFTYLKDVIYDAEGGAKITKETVEKFAVDSAVAKLYLTYTTISSATLDSFAKIDISAIKETNTEKIEILSTEQIITIIAKDSVYFTIDNRTVADYYYVAKGLTYDLTLNIHGFTEQQMGYEIVNTNGVSASEARIVKNNGKYQLIISQNINYATGQEGYQLKIRSYGKTQSMALLIKAISVNLCFILLILLC